MAQELVELNPNNPDELERRTKDEPQDRFGDREAAPTKGKLLELPPRKAAKHNAKLFFSEAQKTAMSRNNAQWTVNELRRRGVAGVGIVEKNGTYSAYIPSVVSPDSTPTPNKSARLCRRITNILFADPPAPEVEPGGGEDDDVESAELMARILEDLDGEAQLNEVAGYRKATNKMHSYGSGFVHYMVNPRGGGWVPIEIEAHPNATSFDDAIDYPQMQPRMMPDPMMPGAMMPATDPETGEELQEPVTDPETGEPVRVPWPEDELTTRYVTWDGELIDDKGDENTAYRWSPKIEREVITGRNGRFIPHDAEDIWDARGFQIGKFMTWGEIKEKWPKFAQFDESEEGQKRRDELFSYRPEEHEWLLTASERESLENDDENPDENLVLVITTYYVMGEEYGLGCHFIGLGETECAYRDTWCWEKETGEVTRLDIPVSQVCGMDEGEDNPYKTGSMQTLGAIDEARRQVWGHMLDHLERLAHRLTFLPMHSNLRPEDLRHPTMTVLRTTPGAEPKYQEIPDFPKFGTEMWTTMGQEQDDESGLQQAGQGVEDPSVQSGRHAYAIISQVLAALSELKQNVERAVRRGWRIKLQLCGAFYDVPQKAQWSGEDKEYQVRAWIGSDLSTDKDVKIRAGTFTQLSAAQKAQLAERLFSLRVLDQNQFNKTMRENLGGTIGMQDDEHRVRIRRQISEWKQGPPEGAEPPAADPNAIDPATGLPAPPPMHEELIRIWEAVPADELLDVAQLRLRELADFMATKAYIRQPTWWRQGIDYEFGRMRGVVSQVTPVPAADPQQQQQKPQSPPPGGGEGGQQGPPGGEETQPKDVAA